MDYNVTINMLIHKSTLKFTNTKRNNLAFSKVRFVRSGDVKSCKKATNHFTTTINVGSSWFLHIRGSNLDCFEV